MSLAITDLPQQATPSPKKWLAVSIFLAIIGLVLFFTLYYSVATGGFLTHLDTSVHHWIVAHRTLTLTPAVQFITDILAPGTLAVVTIISAGLWALAKKELWRPGLLVAAMGFTLALSTGIKLVAQRGRPPTEVMVLPLETDFSFPSGHTIGVAVALLVLGYLLYSRRSSTGRLATWIIVTIAGISVIAFTRLYLGYHWLTDVSASACLALVALAIVMAVDHFFRPTTAV